MDNKQNLAERLIAEVQANGAANTAVIPVALVETDTAFRGMCEVNACGMYGKSWMCPPHVGPIETLMAELGTYDRVLVYQTISELEDSYDFEGMQEAGKRHNRLAQKLRSIFAEAGVTDALHLGAGGCRVCEVCAKRSDEPCRFPHLAMTSLEAYGVNVSRLAAAAGMKYINGQDTVTYFGAVFFRQ
jgi:predicted metal-binding protein